MKTFSLAQYKRVWRLLRKPSKEEFLTISKVSAIGLLVIGAIGFVIAMAMGMFPIF
jgi:protein transport protein SEC61 subunit gamma and related proteins